MEYEHSKAQIDLQNGGKAFIEGISKSRKRLKSVIVVEQNTKQDSSIGKDGAAKRKKKYKQDSTKIFTKQGSPHSKDIVGKKEKIHKQASAKIIREQDILLDDSNEIVTRGGLSVKIKEYPYKVVGDQCR